jgi:preprotein translocase subunit SecD
MGALIRMSHRYIRYLILIIIVLAASIWVALPNNPGIHLFGIEKEIQTRLGLDLVGGVQALLEADLPEGQTPDAEAMQTAARIVENRVNGLGVTEAVVQQAGENRIVVELPGETDPNKALATIKQTGLLEFVDFSQIPYEQVIQLEDTQATIPTDFAQASSEVSTTEEITTTNQTDQVFHTVMTGAALTNVLVSQDQLGEYQVAFELNSEGAQTFADFTSQHIGQVLAIVLDKRIISAPRIDSAITEGNGVITGNFTYESANALAVQLRYGSLPIPLKIVETRTVGPTLGQDSLNKSLRAGVIGFTVVILFMILYYRLPGFIASLAILFYAILAFALFRYIPVTLTLPGIAGFLLSTGSALDANILIFERLKEELRSGRTLRQAVDLSWQRAWPSIRDSNIATLITCAILFWFGSAFGATIVKGFSLTLALGVAVSLFTAILVTRTLMNLVLSLFTPENKARWFGI